MATTAADGVAPVAPAADVTLEETDGLQYLVAPDPVPAGPQIWEITNTGQRYAHHVVTTRVPDSTTPEAVIGELSGMWEAMSQGTTPAGGGPLAAPVHPHAPFSAA